MANRRSSHSSKKQYSVRQKHWACRRMRQESWTILPTPHYPRSLPNPILSSSPMRQRNHCCQWVFIPLYPKLVPPIELPRANFSVRFPPARIRCHIIWTLNAICHSSGPPLVVYGIVWSVTTLKDIKATGFRKGRKCSVCWWFCFIQWWTITFPNWEPNVAIMIAVRLIPLYAPLNQFESIDIALPFNYQTRLSAPEFLWIDWKLHWLPFWREPKWVSDSLYICRIESLVYSSFSMHKQSIPDMIVLSFYYLILNWSSWSKSIIEKMLGKWSTDVPLIDQFICSL